MFNFIKTVKKISPSDCAILHTSFESSSCSTPLPALVVISLCHLSHSNGCRIVPHCGFPLFSLIPNEAK